MPDIVTAEKGAPNFLYFGDPTKPGDFSGVTPIPIALKDAPTNTGEVDDTYQIIPFDVDDDGDVDLVVGSRDQTAKVYFNDGTGAFEDPTKLGEPYDTGPSAVGIDPNVDTTGLATAVDLNGDGYPDVVTGTEVYLSPLASLSHPYRFLQPLARTQPYLCAQAPARGPSPYPNPNQVFLNPGHGEFSNVKGMPWRTPSATNAQDATTIEGVDIDGDGDNDLVVSQRPTKSTNGGIFVLYNPGDGLAADETGLALNGWWGDPNSMQKLVTPTSALGVANAIKAPGTDSRP